MTPLALRQLAAAIHKETRLILRDPHALAVMFIVPLVFVTILSLALRDVFKSHSGITFPTLIVDQDQGAVGKSIREAGTYTSVQPLMPHADWKRNAAQLRHLDELHRRIKELEKKLSELERKSP